MPRFLTNPTFSIETGELLSYDGESFEQPVLLFDRSIQGRAKAGSTAATGTAGGFGTQAQQIGGSLIPGLEQQAAHPTGYSPTDLNAMRVGSQQSLGGAISGITGQANLEAARTRNAGGFAAALGEAQRAKGRQLSQNELGIQSQQAQEKLNQQRFAQQQLQGLYGTDVGAQLKAMGLSDEELRTALEAGKSGWQQNAMNWIQAIKPGGKTGAGGGMSFGGGGAP